MHCSKAVQQLQLYIDKRLTLEQMRALEFHLSICATCQEELFFLEQIEQALQEIEPIAEPVDLTANIMRRVALSPQRSEKSGFVLFRPSFTELLAAVLLATITTLGVILAQPSLRAALPIANGHDMLSLVFLNLLHTLVTVDSQTLMLSFWIVGTVLGVWITLALAGNEMRTEWFKAVMDRLPVW
ncbi:MAG: zf-HC2 domain-containing protein [Chloroflexi bacterium]|nr:zf-HC2 domain-containing protein [Chloroflexota bacterium]